MFSTPHTCLTSTLPDYYPSTPHTGLNTTLPDYYPSTPQTCLTSTLPDYYPSTPQECLNTTPCPHTFASAIVAALSRSCSASSCCSISSVSGARAWAPCTLAR